MVINDKKNFVLKSDLLFKKYYTLSELLEIKSSFELTIKKYIKNNLNDEIIKHLNNESEKNIENLYAGATRKKPKQGLYLISDSNEFLKIGVTNDIKRRIKELNSANPRDIKVLFFIKEVYLLEKILHSEFDKYRINNEWFYYNDSILEIFKKINENKSMLSKIECRDILKNKLKNLL